MFSDKNFSKLKFLLLTGAVLVVLGFVLLIVGLIAGKVGLDILGAFVLIGGLALALYLLPEAVQSQKILKAKDEILASKSITEYELAKKLSVKERQARELIDICFRKGHVPGYIRRGNKIYFHDEYALESEKQGKTAIAVDCPNCGANFKGVQGEPCECPYCRSFINA